MAPTPLQQLAEHDQSVWIDFLSRKFVKEGDLQGLVDQGVVGVTSNPTIFQGAIAEGDAYDNQIRELSADHDDAREIFWLLAKDDIRDACDVLRPIWDEGEARTAGSRSRSTPRSRTTPSPPSPRPSACTASSTGPTCSSRSRRPRRACRRSRTRSPRASPSTSR